MRTRRRSYTAETPVPESLTVKPIVSALRAAPTRKRKLQSCGRRDGGSKLWNEIIPSDVLIEILSRLGLKANIRASAVCKTWCEAGVSVRKLQPSPWLLYPQDEGSPSYILLDPLQSQSYELHFPELKDRRFSYSKDGWLLVITEYPSIFSFFLNPFTRERIHLPKGPGCSSGYYFAFSAAPTCSSCLVISLTQQSNYPCFVIHTWRPGEKVWTSHWFEKQLPKHYWTRCVVLNCMFYFLSACGHIGVYDPSRDTWTILPVEPCPADFAKPVLMSEHEGDIFVMYACGGNDQTVFKLNLERTVWEVKRDFGGLTLFASYSTCFTRAGLSAVERDIIYDQFRIVKNFRPPWTTVWSCRITWVDPPHYVSSKSHTMQPRSLPF